MGTFGAWAVVAISGGEWRLACMKPSTRFGASRRRGVQGFSLETPRAGNEDRRSEHLAAP
jgi:hypothetical protein